MIGLCLVVDAAGNIYNMREINIPKKCTWVTVCLSLFCLLTPFPLRAGAPTEQVRTTVDDILAILKNPSLKSEAKKEERRDQLRQVIHPRFDFTEMTERSLGPHWRGRTPEEQREFVEIFTHLLEVSYVDKIEPYSGEKVVYTREVQDKSYAEVDTKLVTQKGEEFSINYKLHLVNGDWKVYDVVIENTSLVNNYRSQFHRIITESSFEDLIHRMKEKLLQVSREEKITSGGG